MEKIEKSSEVKKLEEKLRVSKLKNQIDIEKHNTFKNSIISKSLIGIFGIIAFIVVTFVSLQIFSIYEIDKTLSPIFSLIAGVFTTYIILIAGRIVKEFTIKGGTVELSAKLQEEIKTVRTEIVETKKDVGEKLSILQQSVQNIQNMQSSNKLELNLYDRKSELREVMIESGVTPTKIKLEKKITQKQTEQIDKLLERIKTLKDISGKHTPITIDEMMQLANYHFYAERYTKALAELTKILEIEPKNTVALFNRAYCYGSLKEHELAIKDGHAILLLEPNNDKSFTNLSSDYIRLGKIKEGLEFAEKAISINKKNEIAWFNKACASSILGDKKDAITALKTAIDLDPSRKKKAKKDPDFHNLKDDPEFQKLIES